MFAGSVNTFAGNTRLLRVLLDAQCRFLVIGGVAVSAYCPHRQADDLDILIGNTPKDAKVINKVISLLGLIPQDIDTLTKDGVRIPLKNVEFYAELLTPKPETSFDDLWSRRCHALVNDVNVPIVAKNDLIDLKRLAAISMDEGYNKHRSDLALLGYAIDADQ